MATAGCSLPHRCLLPLHLALLAFLLAAAPAAQAWTGEIRGRVVCDVCADSAIGPEDHALEGAEVAVLCITKSGEVINYQAFTNSEGIYSVAETMPESDRWDSCLARPISSFHHHCTRRGDAHSGVKFTYNSQGTRTASRHSCTSLPMFRCTVAEICRMGSCPGLISKHGV